MGVKSGIWEISSHAVDGVSSGGLKIDMVGGSQPLTLHFQYQVMSCSDAALFLLCLSAVVAGSDQEHCSVPAPSDEDTDSCPPWFIQHEIAGDNTTVECSCGPPTIGIICNPKTCNTSFHIQLCMPMILSQELKL